MRTFSLILFLSLLIGCAHAPATRTQTLASAQRIYKWQQDSIDEMRAIIIAQDAIDKSGGSPERWAYSAERDGSGWSVLARVIVGHDESGKPQFTIGGHRLILIDEHGTVTTYARGL